MCDCKPDGFGSVRIHVEGELDLANLPEFRRVLKASWSGATTISLDLQELALIDCAALKEVVDAAAAARRSGARLILIRGSGQVDRVLSLTGILEQLEVLDLTVERPREAGVLEAPIG